MKEGHRDCNHEFRQVGGGWKGALEGGVFDFLGAILYGTDPKQYRCLKCGKKVTA